jgi:hypothetical protein
LKRRSLFVAAGVCLSATAVAAHYGTRVPAVVGAPVWHQAQWTPAIDNWGSGMAFACDDSAGCPGGVTMYARTKVGFCNCYTGVANDDEIDRIGDVDLHGETYTADAPGVVTSIGELTGRKRAFRIDNRFLGAKHVLSIVVATDCKAVVATLVSSQPISHEEETTAVAVLRDRPFQQWAADQYGGDKRP